MAAQLAHQFTVVIACGGTGGHFYPGLTVAAAVRAAGGRPILAIGGHHQAEQLDMAAAEGLAAAPVPAPRQPARKVALPAFAAAMTAAVAANCRLLRQTRAEVVLAMGSYACLPTGLAAVLMRKPLVLHESNGLLGRAHRLLAARARVLALNLPLSPPRPTRAEQRVVGMPVRPALVAASPPAAATARERLGLRPGLPTLLAFGGSQGAAVINDAVVAAACKLAATAPACQVIHLTGSDDNGALVRQYEQAGVGALVRPRDAHIERLYAAADLVLCRAGSSTLAELALLGKPAILVPLPGAMDDHQTRNARILADAEAAVLLPQAEATADGLAELLADWLDNPGQWQARSQAIRQFARPNATADLLAILHDAARK